MFAVLTLLSRRLSSRLRTGKDRSRWARHYEWPRTTRCRCYKRADKMMFWSSFDQWTFLQSLARVAKRNYKWNNRRLLTRHFIVLDEVIEILALICTSILEDSVKEQFAVWNHYQEDTKDGHWLYTSRLEFTILCYVPSIFLRARERKTLTTSSIGSVKELTSVDTDVYRFSVATPMHMWVSLVFQAWLLQVFVQHPVQSGNTIQHVRIIRDMYSDILRNDIFWLYRTLFSGIHRLFMESQGTLALITYCVLEHFYHTFHRAESGEEQVTHCKSYKPIKDATIDLWYSRFKHDWHTKVHHARGDTYGIKTRFLQLQHKESIETRSSTMWRENYSDTFLGTHLCWTSTLYMNGYTALCERQRRNTSLDRHRKEGGIKSTKPPRHIVLNAVEIYAHYVSCILNPGKYEMLAQEQVRQIIVSEQSNVPKGENSNELDLLSYKKHGNVGILPQHGNSHGFSQGKELDQKNVVSPPHKQRHSADTNGWNTWRNLAVKEAALLHLLICSRQDTYPKQTTLTQHVGQELSNRVSGDVWQEHLSAKLHQRGLFRVHYGDCWSIQTHLETNNVMELDSYNTGRAQMYLTRSFELWCGTCQLQEKHQKTGMYRKDSLYPRTTTSQASLDYDWYTLSIRQGKRTIHNSGNWLHTAGNETTQQVTATEDAENRQLLSTGYCEKDLEQQRRTSQQHSTTSPTPLHAVHKEHRPMTLQLWLVWYEQRYKTLQHENISARDWQVRSYDLTVQTADWKQRLEVVHSQATQWQDAGSYYISTRNWMFFCRRHPSSKLMRLCPLKYKTLLNHWMWAHQHTQMTSFERSQGPLQKMLLKRSITPTTLLTLLWRLTMFKTAANKRYSLISLVAGHTQSFDSFLVIYTIWRVVCIAVFGIWDHTLRLTESCSAKHHEGPRLRETHTRYSNVSSRRLSHFVGAVLFFGQWWLVWLFLAWLLLPRHRLKRTKWTNACWHSRAKLSEAQPRTLTDTYAQDHPNGYGNNSNWFQQMYRWQCSDCYGGNKSLMIPHARGRSCLPSLDASLDYRTLWTTMERSHPLHIPGYDYLYLICRDSTMYYSSMIWTMQWLTQQSFSLILRSRKPFSMPIYMCWWQNGRLSAYHLQACQLMNKYYHQLSKMKSDGLMYVKRYYRTERRALRHLQQKLLWQRIRPIPRNTHEESNAASHLHWYAVTSAAIVERYWRPERVYEYISNTLYKEAFVGLRLPKEARPRHTWNLLHVVVLYVASSYRKRVLRTRTWLHISALFSQMVISSDEHSTNHECSHHLKGSMQRTLPVTVCAVGWFRCEQPLDRTFVECSGVTPLSNGPMESWQTTLNAQDARDISLLYFIHYLIENMVVREIRKSARDSHGSTLSAISPRIMSCQLQCARPRGTRETLHCSISSAFSPRITSCQLQGAGSRRTCGTFHCSTSSAISPRNDPRITPSQPQCSRHGSHMYREQGSLDVGRDHWTSFLVRERC